MRIVFLLCVVLTIIINKAFGGCRQSYATICDTISDYETFNVKSTEVVIDASFLPSSSLISVYMPLFKDVISLTIVGHLNGMEPERSCFEGSILKFVNFYDNTLKMLKMDFFPRLSKIYKLSLVKNNIEYIQPRTFAKCQPEIIDLSNNKIEILESHTFTSPFTENLTKAIILENNKLVTMDRHTFPPELRLLNLNNNGLSFIDEEVFEELTKLETLVLSRNKFSALPNTVFITNLKLLDLSYNRIRRLRSQSFGEKSNLGHLILSHNKISEIHRNTFVGFESLNSLDLSHNQIQEVGFLAPIHKNWIHVSLAFNLLKEIKFGVAPTAKLSRVSVTLYGNPWRCPDWVLIEKYLISNEVEHDSCDMKRFNSGRVPFCFCDDLYCTFLTEDNSRYYALEMPAPDLEAKFLDMVKNSNNLEECEFLSKEQSRRYVSYDQLLMETMCEAYSMVW